MIWSYGCDDCDDGGIYSWTKIRYAVVAVFDGVAMRWRHS